MEREQMKSSPKDISGELNEGIIEISDEELYTIWGGQGLDSLTSGGLLGGGLPGSSTGSAGDNLPGSGGLFSGVQTLSNSLGYVV